MFFKKILNLIIKKSKKNSLEKEFEEFKAIHKYHILFLAVKKYYMSLQDTQGVNIPIFMQENIAEEKAKKDLQQLLCLPDHGRKFNKLYESAYEEIKEDLK